MAKTLPQEPTTLHPNLKLQKVIMTRVNPLEILNSTEFAEIYLKLLSIRPLVCTYDSSYPADHISKDICYAIEELPKVWENWSELYSKFTHLVDQHMFSPLWVPIRRGNLDVFIDLANPLWPVYSFQQNGIWNWKRSTITMSLRVLNEKVSDIDDLLKVENYYAKTAYWNPQPTYEYINYRLVEDPDVDCFWHDREGEVELYTEEGIDAYFLHGVQPGRLALLPKEQKVKVIALLYNTFDTDIDYHRFINKVHTIGDLLTLLDCGLWSAIDLLRLELEEGQELALIGQRNVVLKDKKIVDRSSWEMIIIPKNDFVKNQLTLNDNWNAPF